MHMTADRMTQAIEVLLVEDSRDDYELMRDALEEGGLAVRVSWVDNGEDALDRLRQQREFAAEVIPDLVLLDLHLPRMNGYEVLAAIKDDPSLRRIPIVIMTGGDAEEIFRTAYDLHANCCVPKPADQQEFKLAVKKIETFWARVARRQ
jgi:CheY-like chemotaxis protein